MAGTFMPRRIKYAMDKNAAKRRKGYSRNPRKATKYTGFRTMIGRTSRGRSKYRFYGAFKEYAPGNWVWHSTAWRNHGTVAGKMYKESNPNEKATIVFRNAGNGKVAVVDMMFGWG